MLRERGLEPDIIEYLRQVPSVTELRHIIKLLGLRPRDLLRTGEVVYRELGLDRPDLDDGQLLEAMNRHPRLIQRPIVIYGQQARIGRPPETILEML